MNPQVPDEFLGAVQLLAEGAAHLRTIQSFVLVDYDRATDDVISAFGRLHHTVKEAGLAVRKLFDLDDSLFLAKKADYGRVAAMEARSTRLLMQLQVDMAIVGGALLITACRTVLTFVRASASGNPMSPDEASLRRDSAIPSYEVNGECYRAAAERLRVLHKMVERDSDPFFRWTASDRHALGIRTEAN